MASAEELLHALQALRGAGMSLRDLRALHHWFGMPGEKRVTFDSVQRYFSRGMEPKAKNSAFGDRLKFVADRLPGNFAVLVSQALRRHPL